jgi:hypothetical protein
LRMAENDIQLLREAATLAGANRVIVKHHAAASSWSAEQRACNLPCGHDAENEGANSAL